MIIIKKIEMLSLLFIVIGAFNWGLVGVFGFDLVAFIGRLTGWQTFATIIYTLVGFSALIHIFSRNFYLPFLGDAVFPCDSLMEKVPENATMSAKIQTKPNVNVVYWGAEENNAVRNNPWVAYAQYSNAGVAKADVNGIATLRFRKPASYFVNGYKKLAPHVHYRVCGHPGMMDKVQTLYVV